MDGLGAMPGNRRGRLMLLGPDRFVPGVFDAAEKDVFVAEVEDGTRVSIGAA